MKKQSSFKMKGFSGFGNSPMKAKASPAENLLKAVPDEEAYNKLSDIDKKGFDKAAKEAGLPTKKSPAKMATIGTAIKTGVKKIKNKIKAYEKKKMDEALMRGSRNTKFRSR